ncbi:hypothetical protein BJ742DRAFT_803853 [Cladochytrium replicatum]|nr:hypothetical protein BJ742DRAFT_803853 [Cladochytrium replicatum]
MHANFDHRRRRPSKATVATAAPLPSSSSSYSSCDQHLYLSWERFNSMLIEKAAPRISDDFRPDVVVACSTDALFPARILHNFLSQSSPVAFVSLKMTEDRSASRRNSTLSSTSSVSVGLTSPPLLPDALLPPVDAEWLLHEPGLPLDDDSDNDDDVYSDWSASGRRISRRTPSMSSLGSNSGAAHRPSLSRFQPMPPPSAFSPDPIDDPGPGIAFLGKNVLIVDCVDDSRRNLATALREVRRVADAQTRRWKSTAAVLGTPTSSTTDLTRTISAASTTVLGLGYTNTDARALNTTAPSYPNASNKDGDRISDEEVELPPRTRLGSFVIFNKLKPKPFELPREVWTDRTYLYAAEVPVPLEWPTPSSPDIDTEPTPTVISPPPIAKYPSSSSLSRFSSDVWIVLPWESLDPRAHEQAAANHDKLIASMEIAPNWNRRMSSFGLPSIGPSSVSSGNGNVSDGTMPAPKLGFRRGGGLRNTIKRRFIASTRME